MEELSKWQLGRLDEMFEEYQCVDYQLAKREFEVRYPYREKDDNVGGGKSAMRADSEQKVIEALECDPRMIYLRHLKKVGDAACANMSDEQCKLYRARYKTQEYYDWKELTDVLNYDRSTIYRKRYRLLSILAKEVGWIA
jgi:RinA family phage transcriptional activator